MSDISIPARAARELVRRAAYLYHQGTGVPIYPLGDEFVQQDTGFVDEIGNEQGLDGAFYWANMLLHFARTIHGMFQNELINNDLLEDE